MRSTPSRSFARSALLAAVLGVAPVARADAPTSSPPAAEPRSALISALAPLGFLVGPWEAAGGGKPGASAGVITFAIDAGGHAVVRHNESRSPEGLHQDVMIIYPEGADSLRALYADSEGHVIHYGVSTPGRDSVVFLSDPPSAGPRFRLSYRLRDDGTLATRFEIAVAGSAFSTYLEGTARRRSAGGR
jgi:hypothetical protein